MTYDHARRFLEPANAHQRRYEALRACFVEGCSTAEAAQRFGYAEGSLRNLRSQFLNTDDPNFLFPSPETAKPPPTERPNKTDDLRSRILELRRDGLSIHDIRKQLLTSTVDSHK